MHLKFFWFFNNNERAWQHDVKIADTDISISDEQFYQFPYLDLYFLNEHCKGFLSWLLTLQLHKWEHETHHGLTLSYI